MNDGSESILQQAVKRNLEEHGVLDEIRSKVRLEIVKALHEPDLVPVTKSSSAGGAAGSGLSSDNFILNELIREYLEWNDYLQAAEVLVLESGQPRLRMAREDLETTLGVECAANAGRVPLLYSVISTMKKSSK